MYFKHFHRIGGAKTLRTAEKKILFVKLFLDVKIFPN